MNYFIVESLIWMNWKWILNLHRILVDKDNILKFQMLMNKHLEQRNGFEINIYFKDINIHVKQTNHFLNLIYKLNILAQNT